MPRDSRVYLVGGEWTEAQLRKPIEIAYRDLFNEGLDDLALLDGPGVTARPRSPA